MPGYPGDTERFEQRVEGLLAAFKRLSLPQHVTARSDLANMQLVHAAVCYRHLPALVPCFTVQDRMTTAALLSSTWPLASTTDSIGLLASP